MGSSSGLPTTYNYIPTRCFFFPFQTTYATLWGEGVLYRTNMNFFLLSSFALIAFAALIHASFQLSVSVLTLVSGHSLGRKTAHTRLLRLTGGFVIGVAVTTLLILSTILYAFSLIVWESTGAEQLVGAIICGLLVGLGIATWAFYYRKGPGTALWLPRSMATFLASRAQSTKHSTESFGLGMVSVIAELIFIIAPLATAALIIVLLPTPGLQLAGVGLYLLLSLLPLVIIFFLVGGGQKISKIQAWREQSKRFLQFASGGSLLILGACLFVDRVLGISLYGVW